MNLFNNAGEKINYMAPYSNRNYPLFGKLAGVRDAMCSFTNVRGLPDWCPQEIVDEYNDWCHSATWYDWIELKFWSKTKAAKDIDLSGKKYNVIKHWMRDLNFVLDSYGIWFPQPGEVIIVVYFDS